MGEFARPPGENRCRCRFTLAAGSAILHPW